MNVITMDVIAELGTIVDKVANDAAIKGVVITSGKTTFCGGADLTMLEKHASAVYTDMVSKQGEEAAANDGVRAKAASSRSSIGASRPAASRGSARSTAPRWAAASSSRSPATTASRPTTPKTRLGLPEIKIGLFPGAGGTQRVARMLQPADALQFLLKGDQLKVDRAKAMKLIDAVVPEADLIKAAKDWIKAGGKAKAAVGHRGFPPARRSGLFQGRDDDLPGGERDLPSRDLR